jgi:hypothetical protein
MACCRRGEKSAGIDSSTRSGRAQTIKSALNAPVPRSGRIAPDPIRTELPLHSILVTCILWWMTAPRRFEGARNRTHQQAGE